MMSKKFKKFMKKGLGLIWILALSVVVVAGLNRFLMRDKGDIKPQVSLSREKAVMSLARVSLPFIPNEGQWDSKIRFTANLFSGSFFVTDNELVYSLVKDEKEEKPEKAKVLSGKNEPGFDNSVNKVKPIVFKETFSGEDRKAIAFSPGGEEKAMTRISYFQGNDSERWRRHLSSYNSVSLGSVYPGIEVKLRASGQNVEKLFFVRPGARAEKIKVKVDGVQSLEINPAGELVLKTEMGEIAMMKPVGYQEVDNRKEYVEVAYELKDGQEYGFKVLEPYNPEATLVIDPALSVLSASTFIGGKGNDRGFSIAIDNLGSVYVAGYTLSSSSDYPTTAGAYDTSYNGGYDIFISKLSSSLDTLLASAYIGGKSSEYGYCLALDSAGNVYITGITNSSDFPTTAGAYNQSYKGGEYDAFILKLSTDLSTLLASTYIGGSGADYGYSLTLDSSWNVYVTGVTSSSNFPITPAAYDTSYNGGYDVFISKLSSSLDTLLASTYLGGSSYEIGSSIALDNSGNVYIGGRTKSSNFPTTAGAYDTSYNGGYDVFISKLSGSLDTLLASTFIGGSGPDYAYPIALDNSGNVYVGGYTLSSDYPTTAAAYDASFNGGYDVFISRFSSSLGTLLASTYLGGTADDCSRSIALDNLGNVYVTGWTKSSAFPTTTGAYDRSYNEGWDAFISKLSASLSTLFSSTFVGGSNSDLGYCLALDSSGNVYITGYTSSSDFPTTSAAYDQSIDGIDSFILKFEVGEKYLLTINRSGNGSGTVTSADGGINCGTDCSEVYDSGTVVTLTATAEADSVFGGWSGDVVSSDSTCTATMDSDKTITAKFIPKSSTFTLTVIKTGPGNGTVTSEDGGISCGSDCSETYPAGTVVTLTATPDASSGFEGWSGEATGSEATIAVMMDTDKTVMAMFGPSPLPDLTGEWHDLKISRFMGRTRIVTAFLRLKNIGETSAPSGYKISFYLSADGTSLDTLLSTRQINISLGTNSSREILFTRYLTSTTSLSGKYLVAVIDSDNQLQEKDETNNRMAIGPLQPII